MPIPPEADVASATLFLRPGDVEPVPRQPFGELKVAYANRFRVGPVCRLLTTKQHSHWGLMPGADHAGLLSV
eukprot:15430102-Alexandrium_andersonii.AAC.1